MLFRSRNGRGILITDMGTTFASRHRQGIMSASRHCQCILSALGHCQRTLLASGHRQSTSPASRHRQRTLPTSDYDCRWLRTFFWTSCSRWIGSFLAEGVCQRETTPVLGGFRVFYVQLGTCQDPQISVYLGCHFPHS